MGTLIQKYGKYAGYGLFTLLLILYFSFLTFPFDELKDKYIAQQMQGLPYEVSIESIRATPFLWIRATGVDLIQANEKERATVLNLGEVRLRPSLIRLLTGRVAFRIKASLYGGKIKGRAGKGKDTVDVSLDWKNIALEKLPLKARLPEAEFEGKLNGEVDLRLRVQGNRLVPGEGMLRARLSGGSAKNLQFRGFPLPALGEINGQGELTLGQNRATVESFSLDADLLTFSLEGKADLARRLTSSPLNLKGKIKLSGSLASQYQPMLSGILRKQDKDGFYIFSIRGTLGSPRFSL